MPRYREDLIAAGILTAEEAQLIDLPDLTEWGDYRLQYEVNQAVAALVARRTAWNARLDAEMGVDPATRAEQDLRAQVDEIVEQLQRVHSIIVPDGTEVHDLGNGVIRYTGAEPPSFLPLARLAYDEAYEFRIAGSAQLATLPPASNVLFASASVAPEVPKPVEHTCYGEETCHAGCPAYRLTAWERLDLDVFDNAAE
jgi:hypothetical protein